MRQFSPASVDPAAAGPSSRRWVIVVNSTTAVVHQRTGASLTYSNKDASDVYTVPAGAQNKLVQNGDSVH